MGKKARKKSRKRSPIEEIGEEVQEVTKKVEKKVKRNWKKIIFIMLLCFVVVSAALFIAGLRIRFALGDDLIIHLSPADRSFTIDNTQIQNVTFHIKTDNSIFCTADCYYALYDRSEQKIIHNGTRILKNKEFFDITYGLVPYRKGSGQKIFNFNIECSNIRSFLCSTKSPLRKRSAFITLNYELTGKEEETKTELKNIITKSFMLINNASKELQKAAYILNSIDIIETAHTNEYSAISKNMDNMLKETEKIFELWSEENYIGLDSLYGTSLTAQSALLYDESAALLNNILDSVNVQNNLLNQYNKLKNYFFVMCLSQKMYIYHSPSKDAIMNAFNSAHTKLSSLSSKLNEKGYSSLSGVEVDLLDVSNTIREFNATLDDNYNSIISGGKNLSLFEYSKKCYLGYCENITGNICKDLSKIFLEYGNATYITNANISNIPYYTQTKKEVEISVSESSEDYYNKFCVEQNISLFERGIADLKEIELIDINNVSTQDPIQNELAENLPKCCVYGKCSPCCINEECINNPSLFPVILIHGHSLLRRTSPEPVLDIFNKIQYQLQDDGYINAGIIRFDFNTTDYRQNEWGISGHPVSLKASYYYDYFYSFGKYIYITKNADNLDTYAIRLKDIIEVVKHRTGKPKVNIIAHSMGGLVARRYMQIFGEHSVSKLILIGTPNHGIEGGTKKFCHVFGEQRECEDMYADSVLMMKLNAPNYELKDTKVYTISGKGCETAEKDGDGVVTFDSSLLDYAESFVIDGSCDDVFKRGLHSDLPDIDKYPQVYECINGILEINESSE